MKRKSNARTWYRHECKPVIQILNTSGRVVVWGFMLFRWELETLGSQPIMPKILPGHGLLVQMDRHVVCCMLYDFITFHLTFEKFELPISWSQEKESSQLCMSCFLCFKCGQFNIIWEKENLTSDLVWSFIKPCNWVWCGQVPSRLVSRHTWPGTPHYLNITLVKWALLKYES